MDKNRKIINSHIMDNNIDKRVSENFAKQTAKKIKLDEASQLHLLKSGTNENILFDNCLTEASKLPRQLRAVLHDKYYRVLETANVFTCGIDNRKEASRLLSEINAVYSLEELKHLKRIQNIDGQLRVIITSIGNAVLSNGTTLDELFKGTSVDTKGLSEPLVTAVPKHPPLTRQQFDDWSKIWPTSFHEDKHISKLISGKVFGAVELQEMESYMKQAIDAALVGKNKGMLPIGAVIVDPRMKKVLCKAHDLSTRHHLQHTSMVCIDLVGKLQGGGAWNLELDFTKEGCLVTCEDKQDGCTTPSEDSVTTTCNDTVYCRRDTPCSSHSCQDYSEIQTSILADGGVSENNGSYLCTGYDLYITREPCVMCSMALLHSRINRVFYAQTFPSFGGLGSRYKIHTLDETNHHFEVFSGLLETESYHILSQQGV